MVVVVVVVIVVDVVIVVFVVLNVDIVVYATSKVDLRLLVMEVEFGWMVGWCMTPPPQKIVDLKLCWVFVSFVR